jgi:hypothetical protein
MSEWIAQADDSSNIRTRSARLVLDAFGVPAVVALAA